MKILIGGAPSKFFHLKEFVDSLSKIDVQVKLVSDTDYKDGFPSKKISNWFQSRKKFQQLISEFKPDLVLIDRPSHFGLAAIKEGLPLLIQLRGDYWSEIQWARETMKGPVKRVTIEFKKRIADKCFENSTAIIPLCKYLENVVKIHYPKKNSHILQSGITASRWFPSKGKNLKHPCVGLLQGATIWGKTREMLVLEKVLEKFPEITFYWVGDGPYKNKILSKLNKFKNFEWLGSLQYPDKVREYLTEIDMYALISGIDMSPLTLQEAQLMQKPVIATKVGGIPELMIDGKTGFLVNQGDHEDLIKKIQVLFNDQKKSQDMGIAGKIFVEENFSWDIIAKQFKMIAKQYVNE
jgi:glycosyltransferase involved in cell wall biosynthesis